MSKKFQRDLVVRSSRPDADGPVPRYNTGHLKVKPKSAAEVELAKIGPTARALIREMRKPPDGFGGGSCQFIVIFGQEFTDEDRTDANIRAEATRRERYGIPSPWCYEWLRLWFGRCGLDRTMGVERLVLMHEPIDGKVFVADMGLTPPTVNLMAPVVPKRWKRNDGFAFIALPETQAHPDP